jgi:hypothetical protein
MIGTVVILSAAHVAGNTAALCKSVHIVGGAGPPEHLGPLRGPAKEPERLPPGKTIHKALTLRLHGFDSFFSSDLRAEKPASSRIPVVQNAKRRCRSNLVFLRRILPEFFGRSLRAGGAGQCVVLTARFAESGRNARSESFVS